MYQKVRSGRIAATVAGAALVALLIAVPLPAAPPPQDVRVINSPGQAVPVSVEGTPAVSISGTPSVNVANTPSVSVSGTPSVNVANTPSVTVGNTVSTRRADEPALQPLQTTGLVIISAGDQIENEPLYTVPAGKRLVIQEASVRAQLFSGVSEAMVFLRSDGGGLGGHYIPLTSLGVLNGFGLVQVGTRSFTAMATLELSSTSASR
jgi:hypothetical protein